MSSRLLGRPTRLSQTFYVTSFKLVTHCAWGSDETLPAEMKPLAAVMMVRRRMIVVISASWVDFPIRV